MTIQITSTTDSAEAVQSAMGLAKVQAGESEVKSAPETEVSEQKDAAKSDSAETEDEEVKDESEGDAEESEESEDDAEGAKPKRKSGFQKRIEKLNKQKSAAQQEAEFWKREALKSKSATETKPESPDEAKAPVSTEGKPKPEDFDSHADYVEALTDWKVDQKEKQRQAKEEQSKVERDRQTLFQAHQERVRSFAEKTDDFQEALDSVDDIRAPSEVIQVIVSSEIGPELMYELAKNRDEYARICKLPAIAAARELGKIEAKLLSKSSAEPKPEPIKTTKAPKPLAPVTAKTVAVDKDPAKMSYQEFKKWREAELSRR